MSTRDHSPAFQLPRKIIPLEGTLALSSLRTWTLGEESFGSVVEFFKKRIGLNERKDSKKTFLVIEKEEITHPEGYRLRISPQGISLSSEHKKGLFRGLTTLAQLIEKENAGGRLECLETEDYPALSRRGFMLDVSRCKVPTMETLFGLIDLLTELRFNELQLYVEHTFAFRDHETVWKDASPLTGEEIRDIDKYCKDRFIELVPNLNSFGHFERWLMHEPYKHLAECPDGFRRENPYVVRDHGTTLKPNQESLDFVDSLYSEYLPNFSSDKFNVGMDEPWELGQGWSKDEIERRGKGKVYLDHLEGIRRLVEKHGKHMQFWADVLLENPENASLLSPSASPIIWGYEANHPFPEQAPTISSCGLSYCLAPGTGTWRSFTGRWGTAKANIESAVQNAIEHNAEGVLLTSWGDCGNHQPWSTLYPPLLYAAHMTWTGAPLEDSEITKALNRIVFESEDDGPSEQIIEIGKLDQILGTQIPNTSMPWHALFSPRVDKLGTYLRKNLSQREVEKGLNFLYDTRNAIPQEIGTAHSSLSAKEVELGIDFSIFALEKSMGILLGRETLPSTNPDAMIERYDALWLERARPGGLTESKQLLKEALKRKS
jgi:hypothetical protein